MTQVLVSKGRPFASPKGRWCQRRPSRKPNSRPMPSVEINTVIGWSCVISCNWSTSLP